MYIRKGVVKISKDIYNLQIPISKDLEYKLKTLAENDDRNLRSFCRRLLQSYVDNCDFNFEQNNTKTTEVIVDINEVNTVTEKVINKKNKVGALRPPSNS